MELYIHRTQYAVGQGGFHAASILSSKDFHEPLLTYIYDCGSMGDESDDILKEAIERFKEKFVTEKIIVHILFISHLDNDHVSGLEILLNDPRIVVERVVLPYLNIYQIFIEFLEITKNGKLTNSLIQVLTRPKDYFRRKGINHVVRVISKSKAMISESEDIEINQDFDVDSMEISIRSKNENTRIKEGITVVQNGILIVLNSVLGTRGKINKKKHKYLNWTLIPYVSPPRVNLKKFKKLLRKKLKLLPYQRINTKKIVNKLKTKKGRELLKCVYTKTIKNSSKNPGIKSSHNHNRTSMSLYSGPIKSNSQLNFASAKYQGLGQHPNETLCCLLWECIHFFSTATDDVIGWLGTGDIDLSVKYIWNEYKDFYNPKRNCISVINLPHHGSVHNFPKLNSEFTKYFSRIEYAIANAGKNSQYKHPSECIFKFLLRKNVNPVHVSEIIGSEFYEKIYFKY